MEQESRESRLPPVSPSGSGRRPKRRILHTSDLHLERPGDVACRALDSVVGLANELAADLVIVAGDFFDHNRVSDDMVRYVAECLSRLSAPVIILPGNHDCLTPGSALDRLASAAASRDVHVIMDPLGETVELPKAGISTWGKPIISYLDDIEPLSGMPPVNNGWWHVGVAHGTCTTDPSNMYRFTMEEISTSRRDYIGLGHWPTFKCVCEAPVKAYYCDSPSWSYASTVNIVDLVDGQEVRVSRVGLPGVVK